MKILKTIGKLKQTPLKVGTATIVYKQTCLMVKKREVAILAKELIALGMYYNRPAEELIFLPAKKHRALHNKINKHFLGKHHSEETKKKQSEAQKGKPKSEESKKKMSEAKKGNQNWLGKKHSEETKNKMSQVRKGMHWYNNGEVNTMSKECPPGYEPGMLRKINTN